MPESETPQVAEPIEQPSRMQRIKSRLAFAAMITIPTALVGGSMYYTGKLTMMQLETAKLNLETAKLYKA